MLGPVLYQIQDANRDNELFEAVHHLFFKDFAQILPRPLKLIAQFVHGDHSPFFINSFTNGTHQFHGRGKLLQRISHKSFGHLKTFFLLSAKYIVVKRYQTTVQLRNVDNPNLFYIGKEMCIRPWLQLNGKKG